MVERARRVHRSERVFICRVGRAGCLVSSICGRSGVDRIARFAPHTKGDVRPDRRISREAGVIPVEVPDRTVEFIYMPSNTFVFAEIPEKLNGVLLSF